MNKIINLGRKQIMKNFQNSKNCKCTLWRGCSLSLSLLLPTAKVQTCLQIFITL